MKPRRLAKMRHRRKCKKRFVPAFFRETINKYSAKIFENIKAFNSLLATYFPETKKQETSRIIRQWKKSRRQTDRAFNL